MNAATILSGFTDDELLAELERRRTTCKCGPARKEIVSQNDLKDFWPRVGCLTCNLWDDKPRLRRP